MQNTSKERFFQGLKTELKRGFLLAIHLENGDKELLIMEHIEFPGLARTRTFISSTIKEVLRTRALINLHLLTTTGKLRLGKDTQ